MTFKAIKSKSVALKNNSVKQLKKNPLLSFVIALVVLFGLIALGNQFRKPEVVKESEEVQPKQVQVYQIGGVPKVAVQAKVQKSGVITIMAQTGGIVTSIPVEEGQNITAGTKVVRLASNYTGANAMSVQRQIASEQYSFNKDNYDLQKDLISKQRRLAELSEENSEELRNISAESIDTTDDIINSTKDNLNLLNDMIAYYKNNVSTDTLSDFGTDESTLLGLEQQRVGLLNSIQAAEQAQKSLRYSTDTEKAAVELTRLTKDNALKQLELQEKSLALNLQVSKLSLQLAQINESLMYPAAPFAGTVERVHVKVGQSVSPGTPLVTFSGTEQSVTAVALVSQSIAERMSRLEPSIVTINGKTYEVWPSHISSEATDNRLFSVVFPIMTSTAVDQNEKGYDANLASALHVVDGQYITVELPIGYSDSPSSFPFVPLDAVYQTQDSAYLFVDEDGKAASREITLGNIFGRYVAVIDGLQANDTVILDRTILAGDPVIEN